MLTVRFWRERNSNHEILIPKQIIMLKMLQMKLGVRRGVNQIINFKRRYKDINAKTGQKQLMFGIY